MMRIMAGLFRPEGEGWLDWHKRTWREARAMISTLEGVQWGEKILAQSAAR